MFTIDSYNGVSNQPITNLVFSNTIVRGAVVTYTIYRTASGSVHYTEEGTLNLAFDSTSNTWQLTRIYTGDALTTFSITTAGQVKFSNTAIGSSHFGRISFRAISLTQI